MHTDADSAITAPSSTTSQEQATPEQKKEESFFSKLFGRSTSKKVGEEIQTLIEERDDAGEELNEDERQLIASALKFGDINADTVCVPRSDIVAVQKQNSFEKVLQTFRDSELSRLPVYGKDLDEIVGFVTLKDMVRYFGRSEDFELRKAARPCTFVPDSLSLPQVLAEMRKRKVQLAVVVDEYGGTAGIITGKDILEQLIGTIEDENEREDDKDKVQYLSKGRFRVDPRIEIIDLPEKEAKLIGVSKNDEYDTLTGYLFKLTGRMPEKGEHIKLPTGHSIIINVVDGRRIRQITFVPHTDETLPKENHHVA